MSEILYEILISMGNALMIILKFIFIDEVIATCSEKSCGSCGKYIGRFLYRVLEFGVVSVVPPIILINYSDKYNVVVAVVVSFFGMKFFTKLVEFLSQESMPSMMKQLKASNIRLEEDNNYFRDAHTHLKETIDHVQKELVGTNKSSTCLEESNERLEEDNKYFREVHTYLEEKVNYVQKELMYTKESNKRLEESNEYIRNEIELLKKSNQDILNAILVLPKEIQVSFPMNIQRMIRKEIEYHIPPQYEPFDDPANGD